MGVRDSGRDRIERRRSLMIPWKPVQRLALAILGGTAIVALAAPTTPFAVSESSGSKERTTVSIHSDGEKEPTVVEVPELAVGETRTLTSASGKPVTVTRTEKGITVNAGEREVKVRLAKTGGRLVEIEEPETFTWVDDSEGDSQRRHHAKKVIVLSGDGERRTKVFASGKAYAFRTGAGEHLSAEQLLEKHEPPSLKGADRRTREAVAKALEELMEKGAVIAPECDLADHGDAVEVRVIREGDDEKD
jgi:hypothetical protein